MNQFDQKIQHSFRHFAQKILRNRLKLKHFIKITAPPEKRAVFACETVDLVELQRIQWLRDTGFTETQKPVFSAVVNQSTTQT